METIKFGFRTPRDGMRHFMAISVPPSVQEGLQDQHGDLLKAIRTKSGSAIKAQSEEDNTVYVIDHRIIGRATQLQRLQVLRRSMELVHATQSIAQKHELLDPAIQILPPKSDSRGVYPLAAKVALSDALKAAPESSRVNAAVQMTEVYKDFYDPRGDGAVAGREVRAQLDLRHGVRFDVGRSSFIARITNIEQPQLIFAGRPNSHDEAYIHMTGTVALAQAA